MNSAVEVFGTVEQEHRLESIIAAINIFWVTQSRCRFMSKASELAILLSIAVCGKTISVFYDSHLLQLFETCSSVGILH